MMGRNPLNMLSMSKYERLLPRVFPGCIMLAVHTTQGDQLWQWVAAASTNPELNEADDPVVAWAKFGGSIQRRTMPDGQKQFRHTLMSRANGNIGWLLVAYDTKISVPVDTAPEPMRRAFADATSFLHEELELQFECDQLAVELTERYEELNLVYQTDDQIEYFEEGQEALKRLVHNCADYLDVGMAALICRNRSLSINELNRLEAPDNPDQLMDLLGTDLYDRIEAQVGPIVMNELDDDERRRLLAGREENLIAYPIIDDHGGVIGLLAIVARRELHTFSNGDRNLLEVMAKKASRIIHTHHDSLTGLINRSGFESSLISYLANARAGNVEHCLLYIDIDQLHVVNDLMGYQEGDSVIRRVARVLRQNLRDSDVLARLGSDDFAVLLTRCGINRAYDIATKLREEIKELDVVSANRHLNVSVSIGIAAMTRETESIVSLLASSEIACKSAKEDGLDNIRIFEKDNTTLVRRSAEVEWIGRVQQALRDDGFALYCQRVAPIRDGARAEHFEILLRMLGDDDEVLSPAAFMPAAERYQAMPAIDRWVIHNTLEQIGRDWNAIKDQAPVFCINLSGQSLTNTGFLAFVVDEVGASEVPATNICFEITETAAISNIDDAIAMMNALRKLGCQFSLDDFGAGLSSFGYLKRLPVAYLKIDGSFVREITTDPVSLSMVRAISGIGKTMGLSIVAEYVEDAQTLDLLREVGVDFAQGYGIGKPEPLDLTTRRLKGLAAAAAATA